MEPLIKSNTSCHFYCYSSNRCILESVALIVRMDDAGIALRLKKAA
jgi:hypothetical protein